MQEVKKVDQEQAIKNQNKKEFFKKKLEELEEYNKIKEHKSKYLEEQNLTEQALIPFIEAQLEKEMAKRGKSATQIRTKMRNNTSYAKKVVDKSIKEYKKWAKEEK